MRRILAVAHREYTQITRSKAFWLTSLIVLLPMLVSVISGNLTNFAAGPPLAAAMLIDPDGTVTAYTAEELEIGHQRGALGGLTAHAMRWKIKPKNPDALWGRNDRFYTKQEIKQFIKDGGTETVSREVTPQLPPEAQPYHEHTRPLVLAKTLPELAGVSDPEQIRQILKPYLEDGQEVETDYGNRALYAVAQIPPLDATTDHINFWTNGRIPGDFVEYILEGYKKRQMDYALTKQGINLESLKIDRLAAQFIRPPQVTVNNSRINNRIVAAGVTLLLWLSLIVVGNMLLQSVIEERSNKLLEALMGSMSSTELMLGKLLGIGGVGISVVLIWITITLTTIQLSPNNMSDLLRPGLIELASPGHIISLIFFFITGYIMVAMAFLTIGSMSDTVQDAQGYLVPVTTILAVPLFILKFTIYDPDSKLVEIASWIPPFTPYIMMARMNNNLSTVTIMGTAAILLVFLFLEFRLLSKIFAANLLRTGKPLKIRHLMKNTDQLR